MQTQTQRPPASFQLKTKKLRLVEEDKNLSDLLDSANNSDQEDDDERFDRLAIEQWENEGGH